MRAELRLRQRRDRYFDRDKKKKKQQRMKEVARCNISRILRATTRTRPRVAGETISIKGQPCNVFVRYRRFLHDAVP